MTENNTPNFQFAGETIVPDPSGAIWLPAHKTLVVSDLHFEKGSAFARRGVMLPPYDTRATLALLARLIARYQPGTVISLGDSFHDGHAESRMDEDDAAHLSALTEKTDWIWVLGNHDPEPPQRFGGVSAVRHTIGALHFQHEASPVVQRGEVSGHFHPCARISAEGRLMRRRCFVHDQRRLILPAMGSFTGGLNVLDPAIRVLFGSALCVWALGREQVFGIAEQHLRVDTHSIRA